MNQGYNYYPQQATQQSTNYMSRIPMQIPYLKGRPVSSFEEVRASTIDFDGSVFFFPDLANKKIYTKQINMDGTASFGVYELKEVPIESNSGSINTDAFVTRQEFENVVNQLMSLIPQQQPKEEQPAAMQF